MQSSDSAGPLLHLMSHVFTYDGKHLGQVKDCVPGHFKVQVRWGRDYWLSTALVRASGRDRVRHHISHDMVQSYRREEGDVLFTDDHGNAPASG